MSDDLWRQIGGEAVRQEAERRVRAGQTRAEVARLLGVPLPTIAQWAHAGRWRKKDLMRERAQELADASAMRISSAHALQLGDRVRVAQMEERLALAAVEDAKMRLAAARVMVVEMRRVQMTAINAAYGYGPEPEDGGQAKPLGDEAAGERDLMLPGGPEEGEDVSSGRGSGRPQLDVG